MNTASHSASPEQAAELFARRLTARLSADTDALPYDISERLRAAREQALAQRKKAVPVREELGCSRATVYRDLAYLRDVLMAPIEGDGEAGFRYHAAESERFELPGLWLSSEELLNSIRYMLCHRQVRDFL